MRAPHRITAAAVIAASVTTLLSTNAVAAPATAFGTLVSFPQHTAREAAAGVAAAMVELHWDELEPADDRFDASYIRHMRSEIDAHRAAGRTVTLGIGLHFTPDWLFDLPDSRLIDQSGTRSAEANLVFNQQLRDEAAEYIAVVAREIGLADIDTARLTAGGHMEAVYPGEGTYWAFDRNALNGPNLPTTMSPNPEPRIDPGSADPAVAAGWADWYIGALADVITWQRNTLAGVGFAGTYEMIAPGVGLRPREYAEAVREGLPDGLLGVGAAWHLLFAKLAPHRDIAVYSSSVADGTAGNDSCRAGDHLVPLDSPAAERWSSTRWLRRIADEHRLAMSGENPGWSMPAETNSSYVDDSADGMMAAAVRQAVTCQLRRFYWAHDEQFWNGTVSFERYAQLIASA